MYESVQWECGCYKAVTAALVTCELKSKSTIEQHRKVEKERSKVGSVHCEVDPERSKVEPEDREVKPEYLKVELEQREVESEHLKV